MGCSCFLRLEDLTHLNSWIKVNLAPPTAPLTVSPAGGARNNLFLPKELEANFIEEMNLTDDDFPERYLEAKMASRGKDEDGIALKA